MKGQLEAIWPWWGEPRGRVTVNGVREVGGGQNKRLGFLS